MGFAETICKLDCSTDPCNKDAMSCSTIFFSLFKYQTCKKRMSAISIKMFYFLCLFIKNKCGHRNVLSKKQVWISIFHIINFKKKKFMDTGSWIFFNKKLILDYYFCLKSSPVFLFQIFIIAPLPLPGDIKLYH